jgi:hypothetical protein
VTAAQTKARPRQIATALTMHPVEIGRAFASDQSKLTTAIGFSSLPDNVAPAGSAGHPPGMRLQGPLLKASFAEERACSAAKPGD